MGDLELRLRVGDTLRLEGPGGAVAVYTVEQILMSNGYDPAWVTTTPHSGRVTLTLRATEKD